MNGYISKKAVDKFLRLPLEGSIDLTYRCNNSCRHCWLWISPDSPEAENELTFDEIKRIVGEARRLGCRKWNISGGEPMLRPDFEDIFDYITRNSILYTLNTNGTLITPDIARLMKRKGSKLVSLYGATAEVHDHITRTPGSFEAFMRGISYLKEAGTGFTVQIIPMKDNFHQYQDMIRLAESLSPDLRLGASWLYLSAYGDEKKNKEIRAQRLNPPAVLDIDKPKVGYEEWTKRKKRPHSKPATDSNGLLASCILSRESFHIDPAGKMSFCSFIKDPSLRFDLKGGSLGEGWEEFFPRITRKIQGDEEYKKNCGSCDLRENCRWCPVYGYLEHGSYTSRVEYLCSLAREEKKFKENWVKSHRRYFEVAGITIQFDSDLPIEEDTFSRKLKLFEKENPGDDIITLRHYFSIPHMESQDFGEEVLRGESMTVYRKDHSWIYTVSLAIDKGASFYQMTFFNDRHTRGMIFNRDQKAFERGNLQTLTLFSTDQILLSKVIADREGFSIHASGVIMDGKGFLFVGHSGAGKSTMVKLLGENAEILCDDRMIVRRWKEGFKIHGTWSHGEIRDVSPKNAPLKGIFFLEQSRDNIISPIENKGEITRKILACLIKPLMTGDWWEKTLLTTQKIIREVPCYTLRFDKSGKIVDRLKEM